MPDWKTRVDQDGFTVNRVGNGPDLYIDEGLGGYQVVVGGRSLSKYLTETELEEYLTLLEVNLETGWL